MVTVSSAANTVTTAAAADHAWTCHPPSRAKQLHYFKVTLSTLVRQSLRQAVLQLLLLAMAGTVCCAYRTPSMGDDEQPVPSAAVSGHCWSCLLPVA